MSLMIADRIVCFPASIRDEAEAEDEEEEEEED